MFYSSLGYAQPQPPTPWGGFALGHFGASCAWPALGPIALRSPHALTPFGGSSCVPCLGPRPLPHSLWMHTARRSLLLCGHAFSTGCVPGFTASALSATGVQCSSLLPGLLPCGVLRAHHITAAEASQVRCGLHDVWLASCIVQVLPIMMGYFSGQALHF